MMPDGQLETGHKNRNGTRKVEQCERKVC